MITKKEIFRFLNSQNHAVISTVSVKGKPQAALVGFGQTEDLELIFGTDITTRKAQNISNNPSVAMVINGSDACVQYEGEARQIKGNELEKYCDPFFKKIPGLKKYSQLTNQIYYVIGPKWIRFIDHTTSPGTVSEIHL